MSLLMPFVRPGWPQVAVRAGSWRTLAGLALVLCLIGPAAEAVPAGDPRPAETRLAADKPVLDPVDEVFLLNMSAPAEAQRRLQQLMAKGERGEHEWGLVQGVTLAMWADEEAVSKWLMRLEAEPHRGQPYAAVWRSLVRTELLLSQNRTREADASTRLAEQAMQAVPPELLRQDWLWRSLLQQAQVALQLGLTEQAERQARLTMKVAQRMNSPWRQIPPMIMLAQALSRRDHDSEAFEYLEDARVLAQQMQAHHWLSQIGTVEAHLALRVKQPARALQTQLEALRQAQLSGATRLEIRSLINLSDTYLKRHEPAQALEVLDRSEQLLKLMPPQYVVSHAQVHNRGLAYILTGRAQEGLKISRQAMDKARRQGQLFAYADMLVETSQYLHQVNADALALPLLHEARGSVDDMHQQDRERVLTELRSKYQTEKQQRDIDAQTIANRIQQVELDKERIEQRLGWVVMAVLLLALVVLVVGYQRMRRIVQGLADRQATLKHASEQDPLTGLGNRHYLQTRLEAATQDGVFHGGLVLMDIDHFKAINDQHGHVVGDEVLKEVASRLQQAVRTQDALARWGGEEFLLYSPHLDAAGLQGLAARLLDAVSGTPVQVGALSFRVGLSLGYARFPQVCETQAMSLAQALHLVDAALYRSKSRGRLRATGVLKLSNLDDMDQLEQAMRSGATIGHELLGPEGAPEAPWMTGEGSPV